MSSRMRRAQNQASASAASMSSPSSASSPGRFSMRCSSTPPSGWSMPGRRAAFSSYSMGLWPGTMSFSKTRFTASRTWGLLLKLWLRSMRFPTSPVKVLSFSKNSPGSAMRKP